MQILETKEVKKYYPTPSGIVRALDGVSQKEPSELLLAPRAVEKPRCFICWEVWTSQQTDRYGCGEQH